MLKDKDYVYAVYQEKSFSKAAKKLFVSQPALSAAIKKVEAKVQLPLFDRSTSPIRLTPAGEYYIHSIERVMEIERDMSVYFSALAGKAGGQVNIGGSAFFCAHILPPLVQKYTELHPGHSVNLVEANVADITRQLQDGILDFTMDVERLDPEIFDMRVIDQEHLILAVPSSFEINQQLLACRLSFDDIKSGRYLESRYPAVRLEHFREEPFLLMKKGNDTYLRGLKMCREAGFSPRVAMYLDQLLTSYYIACDGLGIAFIRAGITSHAEPTEKVCFYKISSPLALRNITLYFRRCSAQTQAALDFLSFIERETQRRFLSIK